MRMLVAAASEKGGAMPPSSGHDLHPELLE